MDSYPVLAEVKTECLFVPGFLTQKTWCRNGVIVSSVVITSQWLLKKIELLLINFHVSMAQNYKNK